MKYVVFLGGRMRWHLTYKDTSSYMMKSLPGFSLLNPLKYLDVFHEHSLLGYRHFKCNHNVYLETRGFILKWTGLQKIKSDVVLAKMQDIFHNLKAMNMQFDMDYTNFTMEYEIQSLKERGKIKDGHSSKTIPDYSHTKGQVNRNVFEHCVSWNDLKKSDKLVLQNFKPSVSDDILMDARASFLSHDYRKTILYSSIACESLISNILSEKIDELKAKGKLRFAYKPNNSETIDPIFKELNTNSRFRDKIHSVSLYLLNRSVLMENKKLYDDLIKVYATRNNIAHLGEVSEADEKKCLKINHDGALFAFETALSFFSWAGFSTKKDKLTFAGSAFVDIEQLL